MSTPLLESVESARVNLPVPTDVAFMNVIEKASANPDFDANKLEKMLEMYERIMARNAEMAFNAAFAEMQSEMPVIKENGEIVIRESVQSRYAKFEDINDVVKPILKAHGFAITFKTKTTEQGITVTAILMHKDGHREDTEMTLMADTSGNKNAVQGVGSSVSYAKRYGLLALLNITTRGEDDDGFAGGAKLIDENQEANIQALLDETKYPKANLLKWISTKVKRQLTALNQIPENQYADVISGLEKKRHAPIEKGGK